jgi:hypothetical protein
MAEAYRNLLIEGAVWLVSLVGGVLAIGLSRSPYRHRLTLSFVLAVSAMIIGYLGFFTRFSFWPRIAYSWSNGDYRIALDLNKFFGAPLVFGAVALWLAVSRAWKLNRPG